MIKNDTKTSEKAPVQNTDPKRRVQEISVDELDGVIGGLDEAAAYPLRMATEE